MIYQGFAAVYDALMADVDYAAWTDFYLSMAEKSGACVRTAVDCACGTGGVALSLAARGISVTGVDQSAEMLAAAADKARKQGVSVPFVRQDMRSFRIHRAVDAVFSACDGVNYLLKPRDVRAFFRAAHGALKPGGGLFFDVSSEHKLAHVLGDRCLCGDGEAVSYLWQNHYDADERILQMDLTFFAREADGLYRRFSETHRQRAHRLGELTSWLGEEGFAQIQVYGDRRLDSPSEREKRIHIAAIRS